MGLRPKFKTGDYAIDLFRINDSESLVKIKNRQPVIVGLGVSWIYDVDVYAIEEDPIYLRYKTTTRMKEDRLITLASRIKGL